MKYLKNKKMIISILIILLLMMMIIIAYKSLSSKKSSNKYSSLIVIETINRDNNRNVYTIDINNDGSLIEVKTNYLEPTIYIKNEETLYYKNGRFKKVLSDRSYDDVYDIVHKVSKNIKDGVSHPKVSSDIINDLLESLFIDYEVDREVETNISLKNDEVEYFSVYLTNILGFKQFSITVNYDKIKDDFKIKAPIFYKEVMDEVDRKNLDLLLNISRIGEK